MEITDYSKDHILILTVKGRVDALSSPVLKETLTSWTDRGRYFLILDFHDLEYMSSAGIRVLYQALNIIEDNDGKLVIAGVADTVRKVFDMVDLASDIPVCGDIESAVKAF